MAEDDASLRHDFPEIAWDEPQLLTIAGHGQWWTCRFCVAYYGLRAQDVIAGHTVLYSFKDEDEARAHLAERHPVA